MIYLTISEVRAFKDACKEWKLINLLGKTWPNFKYVYLQAHQECKQESKTNTSDYACACIFDNYATEKVSALKNKLHENDAIVEEYAQNLANLKIQN